MIKTRAELIPDRISFNMIQVKWGYIKIVISILCFFYYLKKTLLTEKNAPISFVSMHTAIWELVQRATRQLFSLWRRLCSDGVAWWWALERRTLQLSPGIHLQERHLWVKMIGLNLTSLCVCLLRTCLKSSNSLMWSTTQSPKRLHIWKSSTEIWDQCSCALSLRSGFPAETESSDQVSVRRQVGAASDPVHPW